MRKTDPRVLRTKNKLRRAFLELLATESVEEINVKQLTEMADVTRGTFYLHYQDKNVFVEKLMLDIIEEYFDATIFHLPLSVLNSDTEKVEDISDIEVPVVSLVHIFDYVSKEKDFFQYLWQDKNLLPFQQIMNEKLLVFINEFVSKTGINMDKKLPKELAVGFIMYGQFGYINAWIDEGMIYANRYVAETMYKLIVSQFVSESGLSDFFVLDADQLMPKNVKKKKSK